MTIDIIQKKPRAMRDVFIKRIHDEMKVDSSIFFLCADFGSPALDGLAAEFPDRFLNVGIAEQNLINLSTGLALEGYTVYAYAIAPFITMRCYEQIRVNLAILSSAREGINVNLIGVGAGYSYDVSGPSHHCLEDIGVMRLFPNFKVISPSDYIQAEKMFEYTKVNKCPKYLRFDSKPLPQIYDSEKQFNFEDGFEVIHRGNSTCLITTGFLTVKCKEIANKYKHLNHSHIDFYLLKGFNETNLAQELSKYTKIVTIEEGYVNNSGMDGIVNSVVNRANLKSEVYSLGVQDNYNFEMGEREFLHKLNGFGEQDIIDILGS